MKKFITQIKKFFRPNFNQNKTIWFTAFYCNGKARMNVLSHYKLNQIQLYSFKMDSDINIPVIVLQKEEAIELVRKLNLEIKKLNH
jgi:hypothetical protein